MSIITSLCRVSSSGLYLSALALALWISACNSSGTSDTNSTAAGGTGAVGAGGTSTNKCSAAVESTTNTSADPDLDQWQPPEATEKTCTGVSADTHSVSKIGCYSDFTTLASVPVSSVVPGALSAKVVLDTHYDDAFYFQNSKLYPTHWDFTSTNLSTAQDKELVPPLLEFNETQYSAADRRFILAAVTYYEGPKLWALEFSPYDTATTAMIEKLFRAVQANAYFGDSLVVHATSDLVGKAAAGLPDDIHVKVTDQIYEGVDFQPLTTGEKIGRLKFVTACELESAYVGFQDIVVLDRVPNDISVTAGIITEQFQTPLSHINVLSTNRGTPNMGLRGAMTNEELRSYSGQWVRLKVDAQEWKVTPVDDATAEAWWAENMPDKVILPEPDLSVTEIVDIKDVTDVSAPKLGDAITTATLAYGAKSANYSVLANIADVPTKKAFAIPIYYYFQFMQENGFDKEVEALLADPDFKKSLQVQDIRLAQLRNKILNGDVNKAFQNLLKAKLAESEYAGKKMRFRTSTNAEDLNGFPCAGCYDSHSGDPDKWKSDLLLAIKETWSGVWFYRTFREREYHQIDHLKVGMGLLVHTNFEEEEANGVAITRNILDATGLDLEHPYINVQKGGTYEIVSSDVQADQFIYYLDTGTKKVITHSSLVGEGESVLTPLQEHTLAVTLETIHVYFQKAYGNLAGNMGWYAMDVEFKFDDEATPGKPALFIKQARPYPDPKKVQQ